MFKNTKLYRLNEPVFLTETKLKNGIFKPCQLHETLGLGFVPPCPNSELLIHSVGDFDMVCLKLESRKLSGKAVKEALEKKVEGIEPKPRGKELKQIKDDLAFDMLPHVFTTSDLLYAYFDHKADLIVIDTSSANKAEVLLSKLRECFGSLPCVPVAVNDNVNKKIMTAWIDSRSETNDLFLSNNRGDLFFRGDEVELRAAQEGGSIAKLKNQELLSTEIDEHLKSGKLVTKLALTWQDKISFILSTDLTISRIKFLNIESNGETLAERFDSDFALMTGEFSKLFSDLFGLFGGLNETP